MPANTSEKYEVWRDVGEVRYILNRNTGGGGGTYGDGDWQHVTNAGKLDVQRHGTGTSDADWNTWWQFAGSGHTSYNKITISMGEPAIIFEDTTAAEGDYRIRADGGSFFVDYDSGSDGTFESTALEIKNLYAYVPAGVAAGNASTTGSSHVLRWKRFSGTDISSDFSSGEYDITIGGTSRKAIGGILMIAAATGNESGDFFYLVYDYLQGSGTGFSWQIKRTASADLAVVAGAGGFTGASRAWYLTVFYEPA